MSNWALTCSAILLVQAAVLYFVLTNMKKSSADAHDDFADTEPFFYEHAMSHDDTSSSGVHAATGPTNLETQSISPLVQEAQDNVNYQLWHQLLWLIPNTQWLHTQHQSLAEVQWLCLGPDYRQFIAHALFVNDEWTWSFFEA